MQTVTWEMSNLRKSEDDLHRLIASMYIAIHQWHLPQQLQQNMYQVDVSLELANTWNNKDHKNKIGILGNDVRIKRIMGKIFEKSWKE